MMVGQGRPQTSSERPKHTAPLRLKSIGVAVSIVVVLALACCTHAAETVRIRVAWGGPTARIWQGSVSLSQGTATKLIPLGIQADEPGSMWLDRSHVMVHERTPRLYDGFDLLVSAPVSQAKLQVRLKPLDDGREPAAIEIPLTDILNNSVTTELDGQGTRLLVRRAPGDALRVEFDRRHLVFSPGESFSFRIYPSLLPSGSGGNRQLRIELRQARGGPIVSQQESTFHDPMPVAIPLPMNEGVYDVDISVVELPSLQLRAPLRLKKTVLISRKVQVLVLDQSQADTSNETEKLRTVQEIDPANPKWWEKYAKPTSSLANTSLAKWSLGKWARFWQGPLGSGNMSTRDHTLGRFAQLKPSTRPNGTSWEAYTVPIDHPGRPHVLEVEYPSDLPQQLGISVLEPNAADELVPVQLDSGVELSSEIVPPDEKGPKLLRHRLVFWPHTETPMVLITNQSSTRPAVYGKIRVLDGWTHLPAVSVDQSGSGRLMAAYFDRPLFAESFGASEMLDSASRRSFDDWVTLYQGGTRLIEYLGYTGMNGAMISVYSEGGSLYPSQVVDSTPRYDSGPFFDTGQDPIRKDSLEMLLRLFDRKGMRLIPAMEFATPLPELEAVLRRSGPESEGIRWVGPEGLTWEQIYHPYRRMAPYYNVLDPRVQNAMLRAIRELVHNYATKHESFAGLAIQLAGYGYAQLPGLEWGIDDATIARFEHETGVRVPCGSEATRFATRRAFLLGTGRQAWIKWRSDRLAKFYQQIQAELAAVRPGARLYLTTSNLVAGPHWTERLHPRLSKPLTMEDIYLEAGIDPTRFVNASGPILVQSRQVGPVPSSEMSASELALREIVNGCDSTGQATLSAALCYHPPRELRLESFDAKSPYRQSYTALSSQLVPSDYQNRRRFIRELATEDAQAIFDGGVLLPMGQQDALTDLVVTYRQLPAVTMQSVDASKPDSSIQPVTIRYATVDGKTYVYALNDSPVPVTLKVQVTAPPGCRFDPMVEGRPAHALTELGGRTFWQVDLAPYDLVAAKANMPGVKLASPEVMTPGRLRDTLAARIRELGDRLGDLRVPPPLAALSNAHFEDPAGDDADISGWTSDKSDKTEVQLRRDETRHNGSQVVRMASEGPNLGLLSKPFTPPSTGRLAMLVWLKVPDTRRQPSVQLVFEGRLNGEPFSRAGLLGRPVAGYSPKPIQNQWKQYEFFVDNLPLEGLSDIQAGVRLLGPGEVWVDDVELRHLEFTADELRQLSRMLSSVETKLDTNEISDCLRMLEGYWPHFLERNVQLRADVARRPSPKSTDKTKSSNGLLDRVRKLTPRKLW